MDIIRLDLDKRESQQVLDPPLPGLHYLIGNPDTHRIAFAVLERINFFTALYAFLLAYGTRRVFRTSRLAAATAAAGAVLGGLFLTAVLAWAKS